MVTQHGRRKLVVGCGALLGLMASALAERTDLPLNGAWEFQAVSATGQVWLAGTVPGCVHTDLLRLNAIPDPFVGDNEARLQGLEVQDWTYRRTFTVPAPLRNRQSIDLVCEGLDTLATLRVNGAVVGRADNMFRRWTFPVRDQLKTGTNVLEIAFRSPVRELSNLPEYRLGSLPASNDPVGGSSFFRKAPYQFGWDWGPRFVTCGIWKPIRLVATDGPRILYVTTRQQHEPDGAGTGTVVTLTVDVDVTSPQECCATIEARVAGTVMQALVGIPAGVSHHSVSGRVDHPGLWWPAGAGAQTLYPLHVEVARGDGVADAWDGRVGFRTLRLETAREPKGVSFGFVVNGKPIFCKGANWIPCDSFPSRVTAERYRMLLQDAAACHMNMIRVWGGGIYESDTFYDLCDELGLMVWQDFMFSCSLYPADERFLANVGEEARHQIKRLAPHPSLALWCGNNECETAVRRWYRKESMEWGRYTALFHGVLPRLCRELDPDRPYWPSSPHAIEAENPGSPADGDIHVWSVWHESEPFESYWDIRPRFVSEFGYQSFPALSTLRYYAGDDLNLTAPAVAAHQKNRGGNGRILAQMADRFRMPTGFRNFVALSQIQQGLAMQTAVEHWRRQMPYCMGTLYWQLDDCWPVTSWSSTDYFGRPKALRYFARRFYAPFLVTTSGGNGVDPVTVHVTTETDTVIAGAVAWVLQSYSGKRIAEGTATWTNKAAGTTIVALVPADLYLTDDRTNLQPSAACTPRNTYLSVRASLGAETSRAIQHFARFKDLALPRPTLRVQAVPTPAGARVTVSADVFAKWVWVETEGGAEGRFDDNYFDLEPGESKTIEYQGPGPARFVAHSLVDTYSE